MGVNSMTISFGKTQKKEDSVCKCSVILSPWRTRTSLPFGLKRAIPGFEQHLRVTLKTRLNLHFGLRPLFAAFVLYLSFFRGVGHSTMIVKANVFRLCCTSAASVSSSRLFCRSVPWGWTATASRNDPADVRVHRPDFSLLVLRLKSALLV